MVDLCNFWVFMSVSKLKVWKMSNRRLQNLFYPYEIPYAMPVYVMVVNDARLLH